MPQFGFDHIHLRSPDPEATAAWFVGMLGAEVVAACFVVAVWRWGESSFGRLDAATTMRLPILGMFLVVLGSQALMLYFVLPLVRLAEEPASAPATPPRHSVRSARIW